MQSHLRDRSHHLRYRSHATSSVRGAQEDYTSRNGGDMSKMGVGILHSIRVVECLQGKLSDWDLREEEPSNAYVFNYQPAKGVCDKDDRAIALCI